MNNLEKKQSKESVGSAVKAEINPEAGLREKFEQKPQEAIREVVQQGSEAVKKFVSDGQAVVAQAEKSVGKPVDAKTSQELGAINSGAEQLRKNLATRVEEIVELSDDDLVEEPKDDEDDTPSLSELISGNFKEKTLPKIEKKEKFVTERHDFKNEKGEVIGHVELDYLPEKRKSYSRDKKTDKLVEIEVRILKTLRLGGEKGAVDLISKFGFEPKDVPEIEIMPPNTVDNSYGFGRVRSAAPENPRQLATLMHELGHAAQEKDEKTKDVFVADGPARAFTAVGEGGIRQKRNGREWDEKTSKEIRDAVATIRKDIPGAENVLPADLLDNLDAMAADLKTYPEKLAKAEAAYEAAKIAQDAKAMQMVYEEIKKYSESAAFERKMLMDKMIEDAGLPEFLGLSIKHMERDATARAFKVLREAKKETGSNIFYKPSGAEKPQGDCEDSVRDGMFGESENDIAKEDVIGGLKRSLRTYNAEMPAHGKNVVVKSQTKPAPQPVKKGLFGKIAGWFGG